jgi:hypothetical protein
MDKRTTLQEQIMSVERAFILLQKVYNHRVKLKELTESEATQQLELINEALKTLRKLDEYGGLPNVRHKYLSQIRYKDQMRNNQQFRENRLKYFKEYYQKNKERIKLRNIQKGQ